MDATVIYDDWQLQCCGDPFKVGDVVTWTAEHPKPSVARHFASIASEKELWFEDHHEIADPQELRSLTGRVDAIAAMQTKFVRAADPQDARAQWVAQSDDFRLTSLDEATGWEFDGPMPTDDVESYYGMRGYVVTLSAVTIDG